MVRHYEALGLLPEVARTDSGYRQYTANDVHTLRFIRRCRDLGFSIEEIRQLLALWRDKLRASAQVKHIAQAHIHQLNERIAAMQAMQRSLQTLVSCCKGDEKIAIIKILAIQLISRKTLLLPLNLPARDNFHMG